jgi:hypothetical protein
MQFAAFPANALAPGAPIVPGAKVLMKSINTGKFCRVVAVGSDSGSQQQIMCDVEAAQATPMDYTGAPLIRHCSPAARGLACKRLSPPLLLPSCADHKSYAVSLQGRASPTRTCPLQIQAAACRSSWGVLGRLASSCQVSN